MVEWRRPQVIWVQLASDISDNRITAFIWLAAEAFGTVSASGNSYGSIRSCEAATCFPCTGVRRFRAKLLA